MNGEIRELKALLELATRWGFLEPLPAGMQAIVVGFVMERNEVVDEGLIQLRPGEANIVITDCTFVENDMIVVVETILDRIRDQLAE